MVRIYLLSLCMLSSMMSFSQSYFQEYYPSVWQRATDYTLEVAEAMPEEKYDFRPIAELFSFREQVTHLIDNVAYLSEKITGGHPNFYGELDKNTLDKADLMRILTNACHHVQSLIMNTTEVQLGEKIVFANTEMPKENIFYLMRDHMAHHRGQAILYLRQCNITPPRYRGW